jgi:glycosyltransferase involved in cell wall biosynthesis
MPERIRILWLTKGLALGGQERLLELLARAHDAAHFDIECAYVVPGLDRQVAPLEAAGVACCCLGTTGRPLAWIGALRALLAEGRFDVVHVHSPLVAAVARPMVKARRGGRRPVLITTDHLEWSGYHPLTRWANRFTAALDDVSIAVSPGVKRSMSGRAEARAVVMLQGIDLADLRRRFRPIRWSPGLAPGQIEASPLVVTVANFRPQKDYATLLRAARLVVDRHPSVRVVAVGDDAGRYGETMHALRDQLGLSDHVAFYGARDDAAAVTATADVFVVTSAFEAGPITAMEAAALGRPIVSTDVGIMADVFTDGRDCLRTPVGDPAAVAAAIGRLVDDPVLRNELGRHAYDLADAEFDILRVIAELERLYVAVLRSDRT